MVDGSSLAQVTNRYGCGIHPGTSWMMSQCYSPPTLGRKLWTPLVFSHTQDGFSLQPEKAISCLCLLMRCCRTRLIFLPFHTPVLPLLISLGLTLALNGKVVIGVCRDFGAYKLI